jgi:NADPH-dependent glutamate synthase beta subunit-like oxidoreductase
MPPDACAREVPPSARLQHSSNLTDWLRASDTHTLLRGRRVLVVGGGQTSAHLALLALRRGATVTLTRPPPRISECLRRPPMASECLQCAFAVGR